MSHWKDRLDRVATGSARERKAQRGGPPLVRTFLSGTVVPALEELAETLKAHGREVQVVHDNRTASTLVSKGGKEEFYYEILIKGYPASTFAFPATPLRDGDGRTYRAEARVREGPAQEDLTHATGSEVIDSFLRLYGRHLT